MRSRSRASHESRGVIYVAYGQAAVGEAQESARSLREHNPGLPVSVISDSEPRDANWIHCADPGPGARRAKLNCDLLSPYELTLYLDADTRVHADVSAGFEILADGWEIALAPSSRQGQDVLGHLDQKDRAFTFESIGTSEPLNLQAGVIFFSKTKNVQHLFEKWRSEWSKFYEKDQGAFLRALYQSPLKVWLLSHEWNGGRIVEHRYGKAVSQ